MKFTDFSLDQRILAGVKACGYAKPTPIQEQAVPPVLEGADVLGLAQTGTGKTAAFALPILQRLLTSRPTKGLPRVLVLAPTRELALQIDESFAALGKRTGLRSCAVIGGVGMNPQIAACRRSQIVIACPGRLVRLLDMGKVNLDGVDTLVLDEADRMLDMGFLPDIKRVLARLPQKRQNLLFSATMPKDIRVFADKILVDPITVKVANTQPVGSVQHAFRAMQNTQKIAALQELLGKNEHQSVLIFTRTKHKAKSLARKLNNAGFESASLQGNMSQNQRQRALDGFRSGKIAVMVATDIAARGIDCDCISHVVNFDMPDTVETYTHRIGRTGRAGRSGCAVTFVTSDDADQLRALRRVMDVDVEGDMPAPVQDRQPSGRRNAKQARNRSGNKPSGRRRRGSRGSRRPAAR